MANKIADGNTFIDEQGATSVDSPWKRATNHEWLRTTGFDAAFGPAIVCHLRFSLYV